MVNRLDLIKRCVVQKGWAWDSHYAPMEPKYLFRIRTDWHPACDRNYVGWGVSNISEEDAAEEAVKIANLIVEENDGTSTNQCKSR